MKFAKASDSKKSRRRMSECWIPEGGKFSLCLVRIYNKRRRKKGGKGEKKRKGKERKETGGDIRLELNCDQNLVRGWFGDKWHSLVFTFHQTKR